MFSYLRYFSIISFVLVVIAAYFVGAYFKAIASEDLRELVEKDTTAIVQGYINSVWRKESKTWDTHTGYIKFANVSRAYFESMPVVEFILYTPQGEYMFSKFNTGAKQGEFEDKEALMALREAKTVSEILWNQEFWDPNGDSKNGTLVRVYVPIKSPQHVGVIVDQNIQAIEGIVQLHYDVSPQWQKLQSFHLISMLGIVIIFFILIILLILSSRRAESIIGKQHEINLELTAAAATAEAENRDKSQFLANISHELRTPLNAIIGFSEIIKVDAESGLKSQYVEYVNDIHGSGVHLLSLINDILDFSKAEAGKLEMNIAELDVVKLVKNSMRFVLPRAEEGHITLVEDLPPEHFILESDAKKLKQVLLNLLSNAVKFTHAGGQVKVSTWHTELDDAVHIKVQDTGIGIAPKDISRVMTPFGQVDSTLARKYEGTGLGLPLSKKFVEILGGRFTIESVEGKGTTVTLMLPKTFKK